MYRETEEVLLNRNAGEQRSSLCEYSVHCRFELGGVNLPIELHTGCESQEWIHLEPNAVHAAHGRRYNRGSCSSEGVEYSISLVKAVPLQCPDDQRLRIGLRHQVPIMH